MQVSSTFFDLVVSSQKCEDFEDDIKDEFKRAFTSILKESAKDFKDNVSSNQPKAATTGVDEEYVTRLKKSDRLNIFNTLIEWMDKNMSSKSSNAYDSYGKKSKISDADMLDLIGQVK